MSINKYNTSTGQLEPLSQQRMWIGTEADYQSAISAGTIGTDMLVYITDDEQGPTASIESGNKYAVQSRAVYDAFVGANSTLKDSTPTDGSNKPITSDGVYDAFTVGNSALKDTTPTSGSEKPLTSNGAFYNCSRRKEYIYSYSATINAPTDTTGLIFVVYNQNTNNTSYIGVLSERQGWKITWLGSTGAPSNFSFNATNKTITLAAYDRLLLLY